MTYPDDCVNKVIQGDCLDVMKGIPDGSIDMILTDLPYGTTACKWDTPLDLDELRRHYARVLKNNGSILLFGSEPFSSMLRTKWIDWYKYDWYWDKKFGGNFVQAKRMPLKTIETISFFSLMTTMGSYYPQMISRAKPIKQGGTKTSEAIPIKNNNKTHSGKVYDLKYPVTLLFYPKELGRTLHPTQKPVVLLEYLIKTYTNEGDLVLDSCCGSGSTLVAARNTNRNYIGIELLPEYVEIARKRIETECKTP